VSEVPLVCIKKELTFCCHVLCICFLQGGKDAASARYIYTRLHLLARTLFPEADDALLDFLNEDGQKIEPKW